ncbi:MAG: RagB/SusD family nutrient uptake outer membrane protein [Bacteroidetes bacterium]|nr:RagB/SusD family nutrient uptake outer membrane protein [Bacteroidota bacterium]
MNANFLKKTGLASMLLVMVAATGCKKYLDQKPITDVDAAVVFKDVESTYKALSGVYSRLVGDPGYGIRLSLYYPVDNDEMQGPTGSSDNDRRDIARYSATPGNAQITNPFNQLFQGIEFANICIDNIPKMDMYNSGTDQQKKQLQRMYGEALALRAQFYFEAIRNWGDLPAHFVPAAKQVNDNPFPSRTHSDTLYNKILADLQLAATLVPWKNEVTTIGDQVDERLTKGAIKALRARIALFRGGFALHATGGGMQRNPDYLSFYQIAKAECADIINSGQHALNPSYRALWKDQVCARAVADPQGELMFQASAIGLNAAEDTKLGYYNGPTVNNLGNKSINPLPSYIYLFDSTDLRRDVTLAIYNVAANGSTKIGQAITAVCDGKYRRDWISNPTVSPTNAIQYFSLKWQIIRYSDVLLMLAEADNEINGPTAEAYNAINMVRRRGYGKPLTTPDASVDIPAGLSKVDFFKAIVRERALELGGEGIRKYDLIRWNLLGTAIAETRANMVRMSTLTAMVQPTYMAGYPSYCLTNTLPVRMLYFSSTASDNNNIGGLFANSLYRTAPTATPAGTTSVTWLSAAINTTAVSRFATGFVTGKGELLPIPQPARDANFNLSQNPNY